MSAKTLCSIILLLGVFLKMNAQNIVQVVRGTVTDKITSQPLVGALIIVDGIIPFLGTTTDTEGNFRIPATPLGKQTLRISYTGYKAQSVPDISVNSGKEVVLNISMEEDIAEMNEVVISAETDKREPLNNMSAVSSRTFSVEETRKFAAAVNDPGRMALSYSGVVSTDDGSNKISVRGNSPNGLLWRMEGIDIPNPNHFSLAATSGGGISILSSQTLSNSDFITGAFAAEYGNALAGVFDLHLRKGNNERKEYTFQAGFLGFDAAVEGPFKSGYAGSYLVNYRYSTLSVLSKLGINVGTAVTNFQDISFNFYVPSRSIGNFQVFGFGGLSGQSEDAIRDTTAWDYQWQRYDRRFYSNTGAAGLKHFIPFNERSYLQSSVMLSGNHQGYYQDKLNSEFSGMRDYEEDFTNTKVTVSSVLNSKYSAKLSMRSGIYWNNYGFRLNQQYLNLNINAMEVLLDAGGNAHTIQGFSQWRYRMNENMTINSGVHILYMEMNKTISVEPRLSAKYEINESQNISVGYGLHSQMQPMGVYKAQVLQSDGSYKRPNERLGFNKAHHLVMAYGRSFNKYLYAKSEVYYQSLFNIAVGSEKGSTLSTLNNVENYITDELINKGRGRNVGIEFTLEQFTRNNTYFLFSASVYDSKYKALDGVWRNTRYNGNVALSFTGGKEFTIGKETKRRILGINGRLIYAGGLRETPVDISHSIEEGRTMYQDKRAFENKIPDYFRTDIRISVKRNHKHSTTTLAIDIQNVTNRKNVYGNYFEIESGSIRTSYQAPLIPILSYRVEF